MDIKSKCKCCVSVVCVVFPRIARRQTADFLRNRDGNSTVEFAIIAPLFLAVVLSMFEAGWLMTKSMMLERALDLTVRDMRLGVSSALSHDNLKAAICDRTGLIDECEDALVLEVVALNSAADIPATTVCRDRASANAPVTSFKPGTEMQITFIRACVIVDPIFPGLGLGLHLPKDETGGLALVSYSAYVSEPV